MWISNSSSQDQIVTYIFIFEVLLFFIYSTPGYIPTYSTTLYLIDFFLILLYRYIYCGISTTYISRVVHNIYVQCSPQHISGSPQYISSVSTIYTQVAHNIYLRYPQYIPHRPQHIPTLPTIYTSVFHDMQLRCPQYVRT